MDANAAVASLGPVPNTGLHPWVVDVSDTDVTYRLYVAESPYPPSSWDYSNTFTVSSDCTPALLGCLDPLACNFNTEATDDDGSCQEPDALGMCGGFCPADVDGDGECDDEDCCIGGYDECGVCNGPGAIYPCGCNPIPLGACDCDGNLMDALGNCGGDCTADADSDGICDDVDDCVGMLDVCGICNGPGPIFVCGCTPLPPGDCDCEGES